MDARIRKIFIISSISFFSFLVARVNNQETFLRANKLYQEKNWQDALDTYQMISEKGKSTWFNMGNCYYQLQDCPHAISCWKRSQFGATPQENEDICRNISLAHAYCGVQEPQTSFPFIIQYVALKIPLFILQILFLIFWYSFFFFWIYGGRIPRRILVTFGAFIGALLFGFLLIVYYHTVDNIKVIVCKKGCALYSGPNAEFDVLETIEPTEELSIQETRPGWLKVRSWKGTVGWVPHEVVEKMDL